MIADFLPGFLAAYAILLVAASSPGPAVAMLLGISANQGRRAALIASLGIACGSVVINLATMAGIGLMLEGAAWTLSVFRLVGAAYLLWLAWGAFRKAAHPPEIEAETALPRRPFHHLFLTGLGLQVTNPKAVLFWIAIASLGATHGGGPAVIAVFVAGAFAISFGCHAAWALLLSSRPFRAAYRAGRRWVEAGLGAFFVFASVKLAVARS
ncbi:LysE family transporter [Aquicoccus sp. SCR17]|nr:LysE family transporter [Carideicomes alvinocaridis]